MALDKATLLNEWNHLQKDWYSIYQWERTTGNEYTEWISEWIMASLPEIHLATDGLRRRSFRLETHKGWSRLQTGIEQLTEKRFLRAMFNKSQVPALGKVRDYEVPLKETGDAKHGDIDLLCQQAEAVLCVEAKNPNTSESILKAILQAYVYTSLVRTRQKDLFKDFAIPPESKLTPAILAFGKAQSGRQLREQGAFPNLWQLASTLNQELVRNGIATFRFFIVENSDAELQNCLRISERTVKEAKVVFSDEFILNITELVQGEGN